MKASRLIKLLTRAIEDYGDLPVYYDGGFSLDAEPREIIAYDKDGLTNGPRVEIYMHGH